MISLEMLAPWGVPTVCPACGTPLKTTDIDVYCPNENCSAQILLGLSLTIKKLEIKNVSTASLENFGIKDFNDLLDFHPNMNYKSQKKFYEELEAKFFHCPEEKLFLAMPFKGLSEILLGKIVDYYSLDFVKSLQNDGQKYEKMLKKGLPMGIGEAFLAKFCENLDKILEILNKITSDGRYQNVPIVKRNDNKNGKSVCFTGKLETIGRTQAAKLAEKAGFEVKSGVSRGLTYLVTNNVESGSTKAEKAKQFGTQIINEEEFLRMIQTSESDVFNV